MSGSKIQSLETLFGPEAWRFVLQHAYNLAWYLALSQIIGKSCRHRLFKPPMRRCCASEEPGSRTIRFRRSGMHTIDNDERRQPALARAGAGNQFFALLVSHTETYGSGADAPNLFEHVCMPLLTGIMVPPSGVRPSAVGRFRECAPAW